MIDVPLSWQELDTADLSGVILVVGAPDTGKSTFARYLHTRLSAEGQRVALLDGDPGQSTLGPPATMTLAMDEIVEVTPTDMGVRGTSQNTDYFRTGPTWRWFVGAVSPRGHMLSIVVGAARLVEAAREAGAEVIIYDTSGLVDPTQGGLSLKLAKIDLLCPAAVVAIQRADELEPLLAPLRRSRRTRLFELAPSPAVIPRDQEARRAHRAAQFGRYFAGAHLLSVEFGRLAVLPEPNFAFGQLVALEDAAGFTLDLGIVRQVDLKAGQMTLLTPLTSFADVDALHLGDLTVDPWTWRDQPLR
jgi:polynucleotide 5'-hydroxyl-kinase GRC3/NOL9